MIWNAELNNTLFSQSLNLATNFNCIFTVIFVVHIFIPYYVDMNK